MKLTKYPEVKSIQLRKVVELRPDISLEIQALPPDYDEETEAELPTPPWKEDETADEKAERRDIAKLQTVRVVLQGIAPGQVEFATPSNGDPKAYYEGVLGELKDFGFSFGDVYDLAAEIGALSAITEADVKAASEDFSQAAS